MRSTNLPGSIGNTAFVRRAARRSPPAPRPSSTPSAVNSIVAVVTRTPAPPVSEKPTLQAVDDDTHWVYGTALKDLSSPEGEVVAKTGDRCMFVYPQKHDDEGKVSMRLKKTHRDTAQLSYVWVEIYSGVDTDERFVGDYSLVG